MDRKEYFGKRTLVKERLESLRGELDVSPAMIYDIATEMRNNYNIQKRLEEITKNKQYVGRYFRISDENYRSGTTQYCKVISGCPDTLDSGFVAALLIPEEANGWSQGNERHRWFDMDDIGIVDVPVELLTSDNEISAEEFTNASHGYIDQLLAIEWEEE